MLSSLLASRFAEQLLEARARSQLLPLLSSATVMGEEEGYQITRQIMSLRMGRGERLIGRKIEFSNRKVWQCFGADEVLHGPIWTPLFETTIRDALDNKGTQSLAGAVQPRIEPHVVLGLGAAPAADADLEMITGCIDWIAHAVEIAVCPFHDWKFNVADAIAAFGLHGTLIIGQRQHLKKQAKQSLITLLAAASVSLSCEAEERFTLRAAGYGGDVFGSPVHALLHLHRHLCAEPQFPALAAGEIIATGSWTNPFPVSAGEVWSTAFSGLDLPGIAVTFV